MWEAIILYCFAKLKENGKLLLITAVKLHCGDQVGIHYTAISSLLFAIGEGETNFYRDSAKYKHVW